ncbi:MAG TPA: prepilin-type N-terminal cleavage/methylation domain-containing protein [Chthoniobacterales bacterium]|jgi:prepilin-type N-terminal cleavage/methylation domain-containing protein|nr:prepilin-type N-terminal cleavage/methylation domain-containing protein [Chthoniobacterales bacterium]
MFTARDKRKRCRGFTLLEIFLAAAILGLMAVAIFRFVQSNIIALRLSATQNMEEARYNGLLELLTSQWQNLPIGVGALGGDSYKFNDRPRDEIVWTCGAGPGLLTRYAPGEFMVRMRLRPEKEGSDRMQLGCYRKPKTDAEGENEHETWVPLIDDVGGLRIRYFDTRLNAWVERWTDTGTLPRLIEVVIERPNRLAWRAIVALGRTPL